MQAATIRKHFIDFFVQKGHKKIAAAPVVNKEDPELMFTNAGMNQFKDFFLSHQLAPYTRAISVQPCLRVSGKHNDLEEVGTDTYHHTLFEMLGNWSFGDYFKEEAIQWAWELLTKVYKLPSERLYVTIFGGDDQLQLGPDQEAKAIWQQYVPADRILLGNKVDNFWEMGDKGPCGPCTEIHVDIRPAAERQQVPGQALVNQDHPQVIELWNLVFIQYNRLAAGQLEALPAKHVDTGMGLERLAMVLQANASNYDTDLFVPLIQAIATAAGQVYGQVAAVDTAMRVVADHLRAVTFAIADGQPPSNTKAGYVIRRILRRAVRYGYTHLGFEAPFMYRLVSILVKQLQSAYPHLEKQQAYIEKMVHEEEAAFLKTLTLGLNRLDQICQPSKGTLQVLDGAVAFELYDTYGFPLDLTRLIAQERNWTVDEAGFVQALQAQRQRSKQAATLEKSDWTTVVQGITPVFLGYDQLEATARIVKYRTVKAQSKAVYQVVLDQTPLYPEGGGQVGDTGKLVVGGESLTILDTQKENDLIIHQLAQLPTEVTASVQVVVDRTRRALTENNHTATHLLHAALKHVLGTHVAQRGSLVNDRLLRFDFSHPSPLQPQEIVQLENLVNQKIRANITCQEQRDMPLDAAKALGAAALFGEKYGERVRVITFDPAFSVELCGGTHVPATGHLGFFKITATSAVAAGVRRIEAVTAVAAERWVHEQSAVLQHTCSLLKQPQDLTKAVQLLLQEKATLSKQVATYEAAQVHALTDQLRTQFQMKHGVHTLIAAIDVPQAAALKQVAWTLQEGKAPCFVVLTAQVANKPYIAVALSEDLARSWPHNARAIVQQLAQPIQGGGGGKPTLATAGGKAVQGLPQVLQLAKDLLRHHAAC